MNKGYNKALHVLPFDHRQAYVADMFHFKLPLSARQREQVCDSKLLIHESVGLAVAVANGVPSPAASILVDEEFGAGILRDAHLRGLVTALSVERSGLAEFEFEYGADFANHIETFAPAFAKVLVRYNPKGEPAPDRRQAARLKPPSDCCGQTGRRLMFELLLSATEVRMEHLGGDELACDQQVRPALMRPRRRVGSPRRPACPASSGRFFRASTRMRCRGQPALPRSGFWQPTALR